MSKIIISGSIAFQKDFEELTNTLTENGHQVINYPKATDDLSTQFPTLFVDFYKDIEKAEIFYLYNKEKMASVVISVQLALREQPLL